MENWKEVYLRIAERINSKMPEIAWVDLWHEQVPNTNDEYGFPSPAVFVAFRSTKVTDRGKLVQDVELRVDLYLYSETTAKSEQGSGTQTAALGYLDTLTKLNQYFHGYSSDAFSRMRKVDIRCVDSSMSRYLYCISLECVVTDATAMLVYTEGGFTGVTDESSSAVIAEKPSGMGADLLFEAK
jgi:hypothetical protein